MRLAPPGLLRVERRAARLLVLLHSPASMITDVNLPGFFEYSGRHDAERSAAQHAEQPHARGRRQLAAAAAAASSSSSRSSRRRRRRSSSSSAASQPATHARGTF
jgi:hypothetical protein